MTYQFKDMTDGKNPKFYQNKLMNKQFFKKLNCNW